MISEVKADDGELYLQFDPSALDFITVNAIRELNEDKKILEVRIKNLMKNGGGAPNFIQCEKIEISRRDFRIR